MRCAGKAATARSSYRSGALCQHRWSRGRRPSKTALSPVLSWAIPSRISPVRCSSTSNGSAFPACRLASATAPSRSPVSCPYSSPANRYWRSSQPHRPHPPETAPPDGILIALGELPLDYRGILDAELDGQVIVAGAVLDPTIRGGG